MSHRVRLTFCAQATMADVFFPRVYWRRPLPVPAGTGSLTIYFHVEGAQVQQTGSDFLFGQAKAQAYRNGCFDQLAQVWDEAGLSLATTHQIVYFKA